MSWDKDVYYDPREFGLEQVAQIDYSSGHYEYDYRVVWRHLETGQLYTARDSGCSCPSPFEDYDALDKLETFSLSTIEDEVLDERKSDYYEGDDPANFLEKIRELTRK
jgi:hypothetical protein